jgi:DNA invertase Pin-like site-specific DNA recombinase
MLAVIGAAGQAEREAMLERQRGGYRKSQREGRDKGGMPTLRLCQDGQAWTTPLDGVEVAQRVGALSIRLAWDKADQV